MSAVAPGWYKDPADPATQRYWDGDGWLGQAVPANTPSVLQLSGPDTGQVNLTAPRPAERAIPAQPHPPGLPVAALRPHGLAQATPGTRLVARLVDIGAVLALNVVVNGWFVYLYLRDFVPYFREVWRRAMAGEPTTGIAVPEQLGALQWTIVLVGLALWFAYEVPALANTGQTPGKRLLGIKVMRMESTDRLGFGRAFRRWYPLATPTLLWVCAGIGLVIQIAGCSLVLLDRPLRLALHDRYAQTVVVHIGRSAEGTTDATDKEPP